jgi:hypothetical protein
MDVDDSALIERERKKAARLDERTKALKQLADEVRCMV